MNVLLGTRGKVRGKGQLRNRFGRGFQVGVSPHSSGSLALEDFSTEVCPYPYSRGVSLELVSRMEEERDHGRRG